MASYAHGKLGKTEGTPTDISRLGLTTRKIYKEAGKTYIVKGKEIEAAEPKKVTAVSEIYRGPGKVKSAFISKLEESAKNIEAKHIERIQQEQMVHKLGHPTEPHSPFLKYIEEKVVPEVYERKPDIERVTVTKKPPYIPTPYTPGTKPEDVVYGKRPRFDQPQVHEITERKLRKLDTAIGKKRREADIYIGKRLPDIPTEKFIDIATLGHPIPGMKTRAFIPGVTHTTGEIAGGKKFQEKYTKFQEAPITTVRDVGAEVALLYASGYGVGAVTKVGVLGARGGVGYMGTKAAGLVKTHVPKIPVKIPEALVKRKIPLIERKIPEKIDINKLIQKAFKNVERGIEPTVAVGFGVAVAEDIAVTPKEELPEKLIKYGIGFAGAMKGYRAPEKAIDIFRTIGRTEIPVTKIVEPRVLSGKDPFPYVKKGETIPDIIQSFKRAQTTLPTIRKDGAMVIHGTGKAWAKETVVRIGEKRPSDISGAYVTPLGRASPHFLRTGEIETKDMPKPGFFEKYFPKQETLSPQYVVMDIPGVGRIPKKYRHSVALSRLYMKMAEKGKARISRDVELAQKGGSKVEVEALVPPGTKAKQYGTEHYVMIGDRKVPLDMYYAESGKSLKDMTKKERAKQDIKFDDTIDVKAEMLKKESYLYLYKKPPKRAPYYIGTKLSKSYVPPQRRSYTFPTPKSYVPPIAKSYVPPIAKSYMVPVPDEYIVHPPKSYVPPPSESYVPPPSDEYVVPPPYSYVPPPPPEEFITKPPKKKKKEKVPKLSKLDAYYWNLANPQATLKQMLRGK